MIRERPGLAPAALFHLIGHTVFLRLADVAAELPPYAEQVRLVDLDEVPDDTGYSQRSAYQAVFTTLRKALADALAQGSKRLLGAYLQTLLAYPDGCTRGETVFDPQTQHPLVQVPPLSEEPVYPKERALLDLVATEQQAGRRVLVYVTHTGTRDITGRLHTLLTRHGARVAVLKADAVKPDRREAWVAERVQEGLDVLVCHPRLVQTGLDLLAFPTVCWCETDYSVYTLRQASRRSWRIGQTRPVQVVYLAYRQTLQADALTLVAKKLQSSLAVEGELLEDGLAAYGDDGMTCCWRWPARSSAARRTPSRWKRCSPKRRQLRPTPRRCWWMRRGRSLHRHRRWSKSPPLGRTARVRQPERSTATVSMGQPRRRSKN